jgi:hypothetical protein
MRLLLFFSLAFAASQLLAQQYSRVKVSLDQGHTFRQLAEMGLDTDHGQLRPGKFFISEFSAEEVQKIKAAGFLTDILVPDLDAHRQLSADPLSQGTLDRNLSCATPPADEWTTPANYEPGSMGGYFTYQEMLDNLDAMASQYPQLFKYREPITTNYTTHEGRPLYWVKISDNPQVEEAAEPEVLYTALHHAREPNSLSQMIFFMWYLLENYDTDPEVKYLVDNLELYFIPCINPDGYLYNQTTNPAGGGFWRKNRRDNANGTFGVDLNRNYGYEWGFDNTGSSPNPDAQTYRGPAPFSEPETQMVRDFCLSHEFKIALNYHTYGNLLVYPWGYVDSETADHVTFKTFGELLTRENSFLAGFGTQTVGYTVNGTSDDWMYGESAKPKIFSMTPEVGPGSSGFWPPASAIEQLNKNCMYMNLMAAHLALNYGELLPHEEKIMTSLQGEVNFDLLKYGLGSGALKVSLSPISDNIANFGSALNFGLFHLESASGSIPLMLEPDVEPGDTIAFEMLLTNDHYTWRFPQLRIYSPHAVSAFFEPGGNISQWEASTDWGQTSSQYYSAPSSLTDSPGGPYAPNNFNELVMAYPVVVKEFETVLLSFWARWNIEAEEDFAQVLLSVNEGPFVPLCGSYSKAGSAEQDPGQPVYDGVQPDWVREEIDLSPYLGADSAALKLAFYMVSDESVQADGFYFDDLQITAVKKVGVTSVQEPGAFLQRVEARPNPAMGFARFNLDGEWMDKPLLLKVQNALGQIVFEAHVEAPSFSLGLDGWSPGVYFYALWENGKQATMPGRLIVRQ